MSVRSALYRWARILGDISAVRRGRIGKRLVNRWLGRNVARRIWWR
jgi:hypothetical protein